MILRPRPADTSHFTAAQDFPTRYGLPREVAFCRQCVISNQKPISAVEFSHTATTAKETVYFGEDGICDACQVRNVKRDTNWADQIGRAHV